MGRRGGGEGVHTQASPEQILVKVKCIDNLQKSKIMKSCSDLRDADVLMHSVLMQHPGKARRETALPIVNEMHTVRMHSMHILDGYIARRCGMVVWRGGECSVGMVAVFMEQSTYCKEGLSQV